jgi:NADH-quinone oxidoreductase subunit N
LESYRGLGYGNPFAGAVLAIAMFSLAGIPPTAGFMGKFAVFSAALRAGEVSLALIGIMSALVAVFFYLRVVVVLYMKSAVDEGACGRSLHCSELLALTIPLAVMILLGIFPSSLLQLIASILT